MSEIRFEVYKHTNLVNGKVYIGVTSNGWKARWYSKYQKNPVLNRDINEVPGHLWTHETIVSGLTLAEAKEEELRQIELHDATNPECGYNGRIMSLSPDSEEGWQQFRENLSGSMKEVWQRPEHREKRKAISERISALARERYANMTDEERAEHARRSSEASRKYAAYIRERTANDPEFAKEMAKKRRQWALKANARWKDPEYRAAHLKPPKPKVYMPEELVRDHRSAALKKVWENPEYREKMSVAMRASFTPERRAALAERMTGTEHDDDTIRKIGQKQRENWANGEIRGTKGMHLERTAEMNAKASQTLSARTGKPVRCIETDTVYQSINQAARELGVNEKELKRALSGKRKSTHGYHFEYAGKPQTTNPCVKVVCVETGIEYESMKEAALATGAGVSSISGCCCGRRKTAGGYHWKLAE